jgi:hypothetical protein
MVACEARLFTKIFIPSAAKSASSTSGIKPGYSNSLAQMKPKGPSSPLFNDADSLMPGDDGKFYFREFAFDGMKVCVADAAKLNPNKDIFWSGLRDRDISQFERVFL